MLGDEDIGVLIDEPLTAADLFGEDEGELPQVPPASPGGEDGGGGEGAFGDDGVPDEAAVAAEQAAEQMKKKQVNRLPNLNEKWVTDPKREGLYAVNKYFEGVKLKPGTKGQELDTLKTLLRKYEYWAQQCYPKFCFTDVVNKLEHLSSKKPIKNALTAIRNDINPYADMAAEEDDQLGVNNLNDDNADGGMNMFPLLSPTVPNNDVPSTPTQTPLDSFAVPQQPAKTSSTPIGDDMREIIRKKREQAIAKRKRKLEESMNTSVSSQASQPNEASLDISSITECGGGARTDHDDLDEASLNYSSGSIPDPDKLMRRDVPFNSTSITQPSTIEEENDNTIQSENIRTSTTDNVTVSHQDTEEKSTSVHGNEVSQQSEEGTADALKESTADLDAQEDGDGEPMDVVEEEPTGVIDSEDPLIDKQDELMIDDEN